jgi:hypothetical protein
MQTFDVPLQQYARYQEADQLTGEIVVEVDMAPKAKAAANGSTAEMIHQLAFDPMKEVWSVPQQNQARRNAIPDFCI